MAISSLAIMAIMVKMAKMAAMSWPNVVTDMVINGVYAKIRKITHENGKWEDKLCQVQHSLIYPL